MRGRSDPNRPEVVFGPQSGIRIALVILLLEQGEATRSHCFYGPYDWRELYELGLG